MFEYIGHGDQFGRPGSDAQRVVRRATTATAATDQCNLDGIVFRGMDMRNDNAGERGSGGKPTGSFQKLTTGGSRICIWIHAGIFLQIPKMATGFYGDNNRRS